MCIHPSSIFPSAPLPPTLWKSPDVHFRDSIVSTLLKQIFVFYFFLLISRFLPLPNFILLLRNKNSPMLPIHFLLYKKESCVRRGNKLFCFLTCTVYFTALLLLWSKLGTQNLGQGGPLQGGNVDNGGSPMRIPEYTCWDFCSEMGEKEKNRSPSHLSFLLLQLRERS